MDRYTGLQEMDHADALALLLEREEWEQDQQAIAEYESWFLQKTIAESRVSK
jgi:hypothetical protein